MKILNGKVVVITGAASGIGKGLAQVFAEKGSRLILNDYNSWELEKTVDEIEANTGQTIKFKAFDVSKRQEVEDFATFVEREEGQVDIVINNAGVALGRYGVEELKYEDFKWVMDINFWGMVYGSKAFLPLLKRRKEAVLVNISSVFGLAGVEYQAAYCASKFAIRGFTESLRMEGLDSFPQVTITSVHPGGIKTNIARNSRWNESRFSEAERLEWISKFERLLLSPPIDTARAIVKGIQAKKQRILVGHNARKLDLVVRLMPEGYTKILKSIIDKENMSRS